METTTKQGIRASGTSTKVFLGSESSPLLAPRGVFLINETLIVADTAQNRIFIWHGIPDTTHRDPDVVVGQSSQEDTSRNSGSDVSGESLFYPSGIWSDGTRLIVADAWNHRVLIWNSMPTVDNTIADVVIGQPDLHSNLPNISGVTAEPSAASLYWPYGVHSDGEQLWIADTGNRRVLYFETIPTNHHCPANQVIGQLSFSERDYDPENAIWPYSVKVSPAGLLSITDTQYYRVLLWSHWRDALTKKPMAIIGQPTLQSNGQNQFSWRPDANTLNWCYDTCFDKDGIWIADTGNSRLLNFASIPTTNNSRATDLIGQHDFATGSENMDTIRSTEDSLYWPFQVSIDNAVMAVADTGNHRIMFYKLNS